jgi:tRNA A-37 threonylcarbamoyl transferase component Bud32
MSTESTIRWHPAPGTRADALALLIHGKNQVIKEASHRVVRRIVLDGLDVHIKHYREGISRYFRGDRARREYEITREVARRGVPTLEALAWGEDIRGSYLVTRTLPDTVALSDFLESPLSPPLRQAIAVALGTFLARAHRAGVRHEDLHPGNLLVRASEQGIALYLIDLGAVQLGPALPWSAARYNLLVLNRWFALRSSRADRFRFWLAYSGEAGLADVREGACDLEVRTCRELARFVAGLDRRCLGGNRHFRRVRGRGTRGYSVMGIELSEFLANADELIDSSETLKRSDSSAVVALPVPVDGRPRQGILKRVDARSCTDPLAALFRPPPALHGYRMGHALRLRGLPTPRPLAVWHRTRWGMCGNGYLLMERVPDAVNLVRFVESMTSRRDTPVSPEESETGVSRLPKSGRARLANVIGQLGRLVARLHGWNLSHRDLKAANVLVSLRGWTMGPRGLCEKGEDGDDHVWFVDLAGVRQHRRLSDDRKARDLARLNASFLDGRRITRTDRLRFLLAYLGRDCQSWKVWWSRVSRATAEKAERNRRNGRPLG